MPDLETIALGTSRKAFAGYPAPFVLDAPDGKKIEHTIWGDYIGLLGEEGDWLQVRARGVNGWMRRSEVQQERLLEVNFVDVGQGDGCFIVTPADRFLLVDAGQHDNMLRYLSWRFNLRSHHGWTIPLDAAVISHPDADHYGGFSELFRSGSFHVGTLYHNGLVDRSGAGLGSTHEVDGVGYQTDLVPDLAALHEIVDDPTKVGRSWYPSLLKKVVDDGRADDIVMAAAGSFLRGYGAEEELSIEVLAPVPEQIDVPTDRPGETERRAVLRRLGDDGITKNGHSITLRLRYGDVAILLTGDLNGAAQRYLLQHYTGFDPRTVTADERMLMIESARAVFAADAAKSCHHGSADFVDEFLGGIDALVTVASSGDDEPFAHPRPDALGALGKWGRGARPLIFSTELARSANENIKEPAALRRDILELQTQLVAAPSEDEQERIRDEIGERLGTLERSIAVYGLINLRTDGKRLLVAQKLERPSPSGTKWDVHLFEAEDGALRYVDR